MSSPTGVQPRTFSWLTDGFREFLSFQRTPSGDRDKPVSVSDTTQLILESGTTAALLRMKEKKETGAPISQEEWALLAHYVQLGAEFSPNRHISRESVVGILQAFRAAYKLRRPGGDEGKAAYYLTKFNSMDARARPPLRPPWRRISLTPSGRLVTTPDLLWYFCATITLRMRQRSRQRSFHIGIFCGGSPHGGTSLFSISPSATSRNRMFTTPTSRRHYRHPRIVCLQRYP